MLTVNRSDSCCPTQKPNPFSSRETSLPGFLPFSQGTAAPAATAGPKDGVPRRAAAVAPVGRVAAASASAAAACEQAAPRRHAGGAAAGERAGSEVRDGPLSGTVRIQRTSDAEAENVQVCMHNKNNFKCKY